MEMLAKWKESVEGRWGHVQEEWKEECERLNEAREEWEAKRGVISQIHYTPTYSQMRTISTSDTAFPVPLLSSPSSLSPASPASPVTFRVSNTFLEPFLLFILSSFFSFLHYFYFFCFGWG